MYLCTAFLDSQDYWMSSPNFDKTCCIVSADFYRQFWYVKINQLWSLVITQIINDKKKNRNRHHMKTDAIYRFSSNMCMAKKSGNCWNERAELRISLVTEDWLVKKIRCASMSTARVVLLAYRDAHFSLSHASYTLCATVCFAAYKGDRKDQQLVPIVTQRNSKTIYFWNSSRIWLLICKASNAFAKMLLVVFCFHKRLDISIIDLKNNRDWVIWCSVLQITTKCPYYKWSYYIFIKGTDPKKNLNYFQNDKGTRMLCTRLMVILGITK